MLKKFDRLKDLLVGTGTTEAGGVKLADFREELIKVRQVARLLLTTRTAAVILTKRRAGDVETLLEEANLLKVQLHATVKQKLKELQQTE